jgi:signal transduction histidine kinase
LERSMNTVHRFARQLRPPLLDDLGLIPALRSSMKEFTKRTRVPIQFTAFAGIERLSNDKRTVLFRVVQEALTNVDKHARARSVSVSIVKLRGTVRMDIHDDGRSFSVERVLSVVRTQRLGLLGMRERVEMVGGIFTVESAPGQGTTVRAEIPFGSSRTRSTRAPKRDRA